MNMKTTRIMRISQFSITFVELLTEWQWYGLYCCIPRPVGVNSCRKKTGQNSRQLRCVFEGITTRCGSPFNDTQSHSTSTSLNYSTTQSLCMCIYSISSSTCTYHVHVCGFIKKQMDQNDHVEGPTQKYM